MRIAVLADLHANLPALRAVLADAASIWCDAIWCVGDVVGRGPHPNEAVAELRRLEVPTVQGNWDEAVGMDREQPGSTWATSEGEAAGLASLRWTAETLTEDNRAWLRQLPPSLRLDLDGRSALLFHGAPQRPTEYLWSTRPSRAFARIASDEGDDVFCFGHTHETFHRVVGSAHFVAAGSVGCGGADDARARYAVISTTAADVVVGFRGVDYDHGPVAHDLAAAGLSLDLMQVAPTPHELAAAEPG